MSFADHIDPSDHPLVGLSRPPVPEEMPMELLCPAGHRATREVLTGSNGIRIPFWVCVLCTVVYRYQECRLPPGEEGRP